MAALPQPEKRMVAPELAPAPAADGAVAAAGNNNKEWDWMPDTDVRPLSELVTLLRDPEHPAKLVVDGKTHKVAYIHVWNYKTNKYARSFHTFMAKRKTISGIQYGDKYNDYNLTVEITDDEWAILGKTDGFTGVLADWVAGELAKDPVTFFGAAGNVFLNPMFPTPESRKPLILGFFTTLAAKPATLATKLVDPKNKKGPRVPKGDGSMWAPSLRLKINVNKKINMAEVDVFKSNLTELYYLPRLEHDKKDDDAAVQAWMAMVQGMHMPSPCEFVKSMSTNDQSWTFLGVSIKKDSTSWMYSTRVMQVVQVEVAKEYVKQERTGRPVCRMPGYTVAAAVAAPAVIGAGEVAPAPAEAVANNDAPAVVQA